MNESTEKYRKTLDTDPRNTEALNGMAKTLAAEDKLEVAEAYYRLVLVIDPRNTEAMNGMAEMYLDKGDHMFAAIGSGDASYIDRRGWALVAAGEWYRKALAIDPENLTAVKGLQAVEEAKYNLNQHIWAQEHDLGFRAAKT